MKLLIALIIQIQVFILASDDYVDIRNVCDKLITSKSWEKFDCVVGSECKSLNELIRDGRVVHCGNEVDPSTAKVCCPRTSRRVIRQAEAPSRKDTKKDPYIIAQQKCVEYSAARYVSKIVPGNLPNSRPLQIRQLDCVLAEPLIHEGVEAKLKEFPHMALIGYADQPNDPINQTFWDCGGSLISDEYVLTAAHCTKSGDYKATRVRLGELMLHNDSDSSQPRDFLIAELIPHPLYTKSSICFDIMLLKLQEKVHFTPHMRPICLYKSPELIAALHNKALITGWGVTAADEQISEPLLKAKINFANDSECTATYRGDKKLAKGYDPASMICAGDKFLGRDTCRGDSGGPLQVPIPEWACMYWQVGITSYGPFICGQKNVSAIYTKVSAYIPWIQSIVWP